MKRRVGIRDLKNSLSRWIDRVREGDEIVVTDHGKAVAEIRPLPSSAKARTVEEHLDRLAARGLLIRGTGVRLRMPRGRTGVDLSGAILEDRDERG